MRAGVMTKWWNDRVAPRRQGVVLGASLAAMSALVAVPSAQALPALDVVLAAEVVAGSHGSSPTDVKPVDGGAFFVATTAAHGDELYYTSGNGSATLLDLVPGPGSSYAGPIARAPSGQVLVDARTPAMTGGLWTSDGTARGTTVLRELHAAGLGESVNMGNYAYFRASTDGAGEELWRSDGTAAGTALVHDVFPGSGSSRPALIAAVGGSLYFIAKESPTSSALFRTDGTTATRLMQTPETWVGGSSAGAALGNLLVFTARDDAGGAEVWRTDGSVAGTRRLADLEPGPLGSNPSQFTTVGNQVFFSASTGKNGRNGSDLWRTDGTEVGTVRLANISAADQGSRPKQLTAMGDRLFFSASDGAALGRELWQSDGSLAGTALVKDISAEDNPADWGATENTGPDNLVVSGGTLYFAAEDEAHGRELWASDGTTAGTQMIENLNPTASSWPSNLAAGSNAVWLTARDGAHGEEVFKTVPKSAPAADTSVSAPFFKAAKKVKVKKRKVAVRVVLGAAEAVQASASGKVKVRGVKKPVKLAGKSGSVAAGAKTKLTLKVSKKQGKAVLKAVKKYRKAKTKKAKRKRAVVVTVSAGVTDAAGNTVSKTLKVKLV